MKSLYLSLVLLTGLYSFGNSSYPQDDAAPALRTPNPPVDSSLVVQLPSVFHGFNSYELSEGATRDLDRLAALLAAHPAMRVELGSHSDTRGLATYNKWLTQKRADVARDYLAREVGVVADQISATGYGEAQPLFPCTAAEPCSPVQQRANRRTEVKVTNLEEAAILDDYLRQRSADGKLYSATDGLGFPVRASGYFSPDAQAGRLAQQAVSRGRYCVLTGQFTRRREVEERVAYLSTLGYPDAHTVSLDAGGRSVIIAQFDDLQDAAELTAALREAHSLDAYVRFVSTE